jgi:protein-S-isoprenylcysteine O-methyltransferase Ste14
MSAAGSVEWALRHLAAIIALPLTVTVLVPVWLARRYGVEISMPAGAIELASAMLGAIVGAIGLALFASSLYWFARHGRGTLAPWDPPRRLVVGGPYRYVRNPMITGVIFLLIGEALVLRSAPHGWWALLFAGINAVYIPLIEEPMLEGRFGEDYKTYKRHVRRFIPRRTPWRP